MSLNKESNGLQEKSCQAPLRVTALGYLNL